MDEPKYGERAPEPEKPTSKMTTASWVVLALIVGAVVAVAGPFVIALWQWALNL